MAREWFARVMGSEIGPLEPAELVEMVEQRKLSPEDYIRKGASGSWVLAASAKGLFDGPPKLTAEQPKPSLPVAQPVARQVQTRQATPPLAAAHAGSNHAVAQPQATKMCPFCGEQVLEVAKKCKHCGETIDVALRAAEEAKRSAELSHSNAGQTVIQQSIVAGGFVGYVKKPWPHHAAHIVLTVLTCGLWFPVWIIGYVARDKDVYS